MEIIVREATYADASQLSSLLLQLSERYQTNQNEMEQRIKSFQDDAHKLIVAEIDNKIVGVVACGWYEHFRLNGRCCHIDTLIVDRSYRGHGMGKRLLAVAEEFAIANGCITLELLTANFRRPHGTHAFYDQMGFDDHNVKEYTHFSKKLDAT